MGRPVKNDPVVIEKLRALRQEGYTIDEIVEMTGVGFGSVSRACRGVAVPKVSGERGKPDETDFGWKEKGDEASFSGVTTKPVKTLDDAIKIAEVDTSIWFVDRWECSLWTVGMKVGDKNNKKAVQTQQYRVKVFLKRIFTRSLEAAQEALFVRMAKHAPRYPKVFHHSKSKRKGDYLAIMGLFDVHFGKRCWGKETGSNYDVSIAEEIYQNAIEDLMTSIGGKEVSRYLLPIGNDFFHMDNAKNTTTAGTQMDVDGRYAQVIEAGEMAVVKAVERLLTRAPVDIVWVPGNHDTTNSYHLARFLWSWFHNNDSVSVDFGPSKRKYYSWGSTLIGLTHGNVEPIASLPNLMATERPEEWLDSKTGSREWLIGHWHQSRKWVTKTTETSQGTVVRALMSLSGTDSWHHDHGYIGNHQAAEVYLYERKSGYCGHNVSYARP